jgi:hypothetical protein
VTVVTSKRREELSKSSRWFLFSEMLAVDYVLRSQQLCFNSNFDSVELVDSEAWIGWFFSFCMTALTMLSIE